MKISEFECLKGYHCKRPVLFHKEMDYAQAIYNANIPYRPGVYLVYSLSMEGEDNELLYFGKAGVTGNVNDSVINFHQLPIRLLAATKRPIEYKESTSEFVTRAKLWPWYVETQFEYGIKIYWFLTDWPKQNPNEMEKNIKLELKQKNQKWKKSI